MYRNDSISDISVNEVSDDDDDPMSEYGSQQYSHETKIATDITSSTPLSTSFHGDDDDDDNDDKDDDTKNNNNYHVCHAAESATVSSDQQHQNDDVFTPEPVRCVTSDFTDTPPRHSTPIITNHDDVINRTPSTVSAPNLPGID